MQEDEASAAASDIEMETQGGIDEVPPSMDVQLTARVERFLPQMGTEDWWLQVSSFPGVELKERHLHKVLEKASETTVGQEYIEIPLVLSMKLNDNFVRSREAISSLWVLVCFREGRLTLHRPQCLESRPDLISSINPGMLPGGDEERPHDEESQDKIVTAVAETQAPTSNVNTSPDPHGPGEKLEFACHEELMNGSGDRAYTLGEKENVVEVTNDEGTMGVAHNAADDQEVDPDDFELDESVVLGDDCVPEGDDAVEDENPSVPFDLTVAEVDNEKKAGTIRSPCAQITNQDADGLEIRVSDEEAYSLLDSADEDNGDYNDKEGTVARIQESIKDQTPLLEAQEGQTTSDMKRASVIRLLS